MPQRVYVSERKNRGTFWFRLGLFCSATAPSGSLPVCRSKSQLLGWKLPALFGPNDECCKP